MKRTLILLMLFWVLTGCGSSSIHTEIRPDVAGQQKEVAERSRAYIEKLFHVEHGSTAERIAGFVHPEYTLNPDTVLRKVNQIVGGPEQSLRLKSASVKEILINGDTATVEIDVQLLKKTGTQTSLDSGIWQGILREENGKWLVVSDRFQRPSSDEHATGTSFSQLPLPNGEYSIEELLRYLNLPLGEGADGKKANHLSSVSPQPAATADSPSQPLDNKEKQSRTHTAQAEHAKHKEQKSGSAEQRRQATSALSKAAETAPEGVKPEPLLPAETELVVLYKNVPVPLSTSSGLVRALGFPDKLYFDEERQSQILEYPGLKAAVKGQVLASLEITAGGAQLKEGIKAGSRMADLVAKYGQPKEKKGSYYLYSFKNAELMPEFAGETIERLHVVPRNLAAPDPRDTFLRITNTSQSEIYNRIYKNACAACHGVYLEGGKGPALNKIGSKRTLDEISRIIEEGEGEMPAPEIDQSDVDPLALWLYLQK